MQTENTAPIDTTTAPTGQVDPALQTTTPPANGNEDAAQGQQADSSKPADSQDDQSTQQDAEDQPRDDQGRFKPKVQRRIDELTHARRAAERERDYWRSQAEARNTTPAPQPHEFASDEDYEAAARQHEIKQAARDVVAETAKATADRFDQDVQNTLDEAYRHRVQDVAARMSDYMEVVGNSDVHIPGEMIQGLKESDYGPEIMYHLAKHPQEADQLRGMNARQLDRALGRLEALVSARPTPAAVAAAPVARTTSAPPPPNPGSVGGAPPNNDPSTMSQPQFEAWLKTQGARHI